MPRGDGTGPMGTGPMGRGRGGCMTGRGMFGAGMGVGAGRRYSAGFTPQVADPQALESQAEQLQHQVDAMRAQAQSMRRTKPAE